MADNLNDLLRRELIEIDRRMQDLVQRRQAVLNLLSPRLSPGKSGVNSAKLLAMPSLEEKLSTLDMAQSVIEEHGEMKAEDIMEAIRQEFGIKPAHTLPQMLYIRARAKKRFYRSPEGKFGLIESRRKQSGKKAA